MARRPPDYLADRLGNPGVSPGQFGEHRRLAVAPDRYDRQVELPQERQTLMGHRAGHDVLADHEPVHFGAVDFTSHRLQGGQVAVDVVEGGDSHGWILQLVQAARGSAVGARGRVAEPMSRAEEGKRPTIVGSSRLRLASKE